MTRSGEHEQEGLGWFTRPGLDGAGGELAPGAHTAPRAGSGTRTRVERFELSSRGDRVTGVLAQPVSGDAPLPLALLADTTSTLPAGRALPLSLMLASEGMAVAQIDLPLHGARAEHKLASCVAAGWSGHGELACLAREFAAQSLSDLQRSLEALRARGPIDARRFAFIGVGLAADVGARFCADDPRVAAAVLGLAGQRDAAPDLDPAAAIADYGPRPLLLLEAGRESDRRLREAAVEPPSHHPIDASDPLGEDETRVVIQRFLREALGR